MKIPLQDQPFRVLTMLLWRAGELVTREEFQQALWPAGTYVEFDEGLNKAIQKLRQALDDSPDNPIFIETLHRKGYRFIAPVERLAGEAPAAVPLSTLVGDSAVSPPATASVKGWRTGVLAWAAFGAVSLALIFLAGVHFGFDCEGGGVLVSATAGANTWPAHADALTLWIALGPRISAVFASFELAAFGSLSAAV